MPMNIHNGQDNNHLDANNYLDKPGKLQTRQKEKIQISAAEKNQETEKPSKTIPVPKDEYISSEKSDNRPSGLYSVKRDENGNPKVIFDNPKKSEKKENERKQEIDPKNASDNKAEKCTTNTDQVDREIKNLKNKRQQLKQQIISQADDDKKIQQLKQKLAQIENELKQKDNDAYRRQHAVTSNTAI